ncbi:HTH-type transcriptional repressor YvoA [Streptomyces hundungensis]|uniref:HTH-type transcriptional repressor YvoA n=1 Tax=Streptomyces hundungensis TaxID=1077946 RepID=A0A387HEH4_9ACTN|nr:GntR family transcriptional regulator [Streptomyces hundungensis]AYG81889.1 HTH-type transcriptional repressor YvoA [Streptomyces hundungensis]
MAVLKYEQIADSLRARIAEGEFGADDLLPSQRDLCARWGVSRATVIKAYDTLVADGLVSARQGQGFRVTRLPLARPAGARKAGTDRTTGGRAFEILGVPAREIPPIRVARALATSGDALPLRRDRLIRLADGAPLSVVRAWFPPEIADECPRLERPEPIAEGTTRYVARMTGRHPARGVDEKTVRLATAEEAQLLAKEAPFAVLVVLHVAYDEDDRAIVVEQGVTPGDLWEDTEGYVMGDIR